MTGPSEFLLGEFQRTLDDRYRLSVPHELGSLLAAESADCILAKERPGCVSLWATAAWQTRLDEAVELVRRKMVSGKLEGRIGEVQLLGRLLSTRHRAVQLAGRGRLLIPEGFREFLGRRARRRGTRGGGGRLHRDLESVAVVEIPRNPDAKVPAFAGPAFRLTVCSMPGPADRSPTLPAASPGGVQVNTEGLSGCTMRPPLFPGPGVEVFGLAAGVLWRPVEEEVELAMAACHRWQCLTGHSLTHC